MRKRTEKNEIDVVVFGGQVFVTSSQCETSGR
jgi:hypothetical protein